MKKVLFVVTFFILFFASLTNSAFAHPGNVASDGCHYCRTNCASWGYTYGTRHTHGGNTCACGTPVDPLYCRQNAAPPIQEVIPTTIPTTIPTQKPIIILPTNTPTPIIIPTFTPTQTPTLAVTPTKKPTPTRKPPKKVLGKKIVRQNSVIKNQTIFQRIFNFFFHQ